MAILDNNQQILNAIQTAGANAVDEFAAVVHGKELKLRVSKHKEFNEQIVITISR